MSVRDEFDEWAAAGRDRGMEERHWHTAKHILAGMPVESGDAVLDLGTGSGYALRALRETAGADRGYGLDGAPEMLHNARGYTDDPRIGYLLGDFDTLPFARDSIDHCFSMEAFFYASNPDRTLAEIARVLCPGGTFHCGVNFFEESHHSHVWDERIDVDMILWSREAYREAFERAGLHVAAQRQIPDRDTEIPPEDAFPTEEWDSRADMVERYREHGTLLTVGVVP